MVLITDNVFINIISFIPSHKDHTIMSISNKKLFTMCNKYFHKTVMSFPERYFSDCKPYIKELCILICKMNREEKLKLHK